ncbi:hypothetical protein [Xylanivirga thermophila]|uniref:hypothetical protein n=1 Tax=Xylanivirga thermophila TaxID=2496273 RepID=UPI0013EC472E|nr:hypothetical protein [Xylanivirga thermophila]
MIARKPRYIGTIMIICIVAVIAFSSIWFFHNKEEKQNKTYSGAKFVEVDDMYERTRNIYSI